MTIKQSEKNLVCVC